MNGNEGDAVQAPVKHPSTADLLLLDTGLNASTFNVASSRFTVAWAFYLWTYQCV